MITTTGYASEDFTLWSNAAIGLFFLASFIGGCAGSTAGGIKANRLVILYLVVRSSFRRLVRPHAIVRLKYGNDEISSQTIETVTIFFFLFFGTLLTGTVLLSMFGLDLITAFSGALTAISNVGPGFGQIIGPAGNFASLARSGPLGAVRRDAARSARTRHRPDPVLPDGLGGLAVTAAGIPSAPPCVFINLDRADERRRFMHAGAARLGLALERFAALTPDDVPEPVHRALSTRWERPMTRIELAVFLSHRALWERAAVSERGLVILEDDVVLSPRISRLPRRAAGSLRARQPRMVRPAEVLSQARYGRRRGGGTADAGGAGQGGSRRLFREPARARAGCLPPRRITLRRPTPSSIAAVAC